MLSGALEAGSDGPLANHGRVKADLTGCTAPVGTGQLARDDEGDNPKCAPGNSLPRGARDVSLWPNVRFRPIADISSLVTVRWMNISIGATKAIKGLLTVVLLGAFSAFVFTGERSNQMLLSTAHAPASVCRSRPADYQIVDMKGPVCVTHEAAVAWNRNEQYLQLAVGIAAASFLALFLIHRKVPEVSKREEWTLPLGVVACFGVFSIWGFLPAVVCAGALILGLIGARLFKRA
jgi:hypothetical protein